MSFITRITAGITDCPKDGETAQEARDDAVKRGVLPPEQSPHLNLDQDVTRIDSPDEPAT